MAAAQVGDLTIAYDDVGEGTPILLIHGHPFNRSMWADQVRVLATDRRLITPDLRGYGESTVVPGKTLLDDFAGDMAGLLDHLGIDRAVVGGLSMGGQIVLEFYRRFPDRALGLILADTFAQADGPEARRIRVETADRLLAEGMDGYAVEALPRMVSPRTIRELPGAAAHVLEMMRSTDPRGAAAALRGRAERRDYTELLAEVGVPTLIVVGSEDEFTPVRDASYMRDRIPGAVIVVVEGAGHMPNLEAAADFNRAVGRFLDDAGL